MKSPRYLIVNGDDFGLSTTVNQSILESHREGILTSTSLMVTGEAWTEAVALAKDHPNLGVGLHLVLVKGKSVLSPQTIPHLVNGEGYFGDDPVKVGLQYQFNSQARSELKQEIQAQLERSLTTGLPLSHLDGHLHLHLHPVVLGILAELAPNYGIKYLRLPKEELRLDLDLNPGNFFSKLATALVFAQLHRHGLKVMESRGVTTPERVYGLLATGKVGEDYLLKLIPQIKAGLVEIYAHPDQQDSGLEEKRGLLSPRVKACIEDQGLILTNYLKLA